MIISKTPLVVNLFEQDVGRQGNTKVINLAIDKYVYCIVQKRIDRKIRIGYSKIETVSAFSQIKHRLVKETMKELKLKNGIEISYLADINAREGAGSLGSGVATAVGTLSALYCLAGLTPSSEQLQDTAFQIGKKCLNEEASLTDFTTVVYGGVRLFDVSGRKNIKITGSLRLDLKKEFRKELEEYLSLFLVKNKLSLARKVKNQSYPKVKFVDQKFFQELLDSIRERNFPEASGFLDEVWNLSVDRIPSGVIEVYENVREAGVLGGKFHSTRNEGAHFFLMVRDRKRQQIRQSMKQFREIFVGIDSIGSRIIFNDEK